MKLFSRKLWMTVFAAALTALGFWWQVDYLYSFAEYARPDKGYEPGTAQMLVTAYTSMAKDHGVLFAAIVLAYLGVAGAIQWRHGTESVTQLASAAQSIFRKNEEDISETRRIEVDESRAKYDDDLG